MVLIIRQVFVVDRHLDLRENIDVVIVRSLFYVFNFAFDFVVLEKAENAAHLYECQDLHIMQRQGNKGSPKVAEHPAITYLPVYQNLSVVDMHVL